MTKQTNNRASSSWHLKMFLRLACNGTDGLCPGTTFETATFCVRVGCNDLGRWRDLKKLANVYLCVLTMLDSMRAESWLDTEVTFSHLTCHLTCLWKLLSKDFFVTSLGVYTVKTGIVSCFIAENIWLLTFCHELWWIWRSYLPNLAALAQYSHMHYGIQCMCENTQNGARCIWPVAKNVILRYIIYIYICSTLSRNLRFLGIPRKPAIL